jgi:hypothetical protein
MYPLNQLKMLVSCGRDPARSLPFRRGFLLIPLVLVCFAFSPQTRAACDSPDPGCPGGNLAEGFDALLSLSGGLYNTGIGAFSLLSDTTGSLNTGVGAGTLLSQSTAIEGTAVGAGALFSNNGANNTAVGAFALFSNQGDPDPDVGVGAFNNAVGANSLLLNVSGSSNNALGESALFANTSGSANTAVGDVAASAGAGDDFSLNTVVGSGALFSSTAGNSNNAVGADALVNDNSIGFNNVMGVDAMADNVNGSGNTAIGDAAGAGVDGSFNIYIGFGVTGPGNEDNTIRIGDTLDTGCFIGGISGVVVTGDPVLVAADGQLGVGPAGSPLTAKEILKERQVVQQLKTTTERQAARIALQEQQIQTLTAALKQQAEQIQKVSAQLEMIRPTPRVVENR